MFMPPSGLRTLALDPVNQAWEHMGEQHKINAHLFRALLVMSHL